MNPEYMEYAPTATAQVLTVVVVTSILTQIIVKNIVKINYKNIVRFFEESNDIFLYYQMRLHNRNEPIQEIMMQIS